MHAAPKVLLPFEIVLFAAASLVHAGILAHGLEHVRAATAEGVIASVLVLGLIACLVFRGRARTIALAAQGFALLGTLVGALTIALGVGPQTRADHVFHGVLLVVLIGGLVFTARAGASASPPAPS